MRLESDHGTTGSDAASGGQRVDANVRADVEEDAIGGKHRLHQADDLNIIAVQTGPEDLQLVLVGQVEKNPPHVRQLHFDLFGREQAIQKRSNAPAATSGQRAEQTGQRRASESRQVHDRPPVVILRAVLDDDVDPFTVGGGRSVVLFSR